MMTDGETVLDVHQLIGRRFGPVDVQVRAGEIVGIAGAGLKRLFAAHHVFVFVERMAEGRLEVDHVAQQNLFVQKFVAPDRDCLEGQRAFTKPRDHRVARNNFV